jgi:hypothetical protein
VYVLVTDHLARGVLLFIWSRFEQDHSAFGEDKQWVLSIPTILVFPVRKFCNNAAVEQDKMLLKTRETAKEPASVDFQTQYLCSVIITVLSVSSPTINTN